jgi:sugar phosphate isomerase/epimerase
MMNNPRTDLLAEIAWASQNRFEFLDLTLEPSAAHPRQIAVPAVRRALKDAGLKIVGHTAYYLPLASPLATLREAARTEIVWALEVLADARAMCHAVGGPADPGRADLLEELRNIHKKIQTQRSLRNEEKI